MTEGHVPDIGAEPDPAAHTGNSPALDEVRADIAATRAELRDTVDALGDKLDVKKRGQDAVSAAGKRIGDAAVSVKHAAPEPVQHAVDRTAATAGPWVRQAGAAVAPYRKQILAGAAAAVLVFVLVRRRRAS